MPSVHVGTNRFNAVTRVFRIYMELFRLPSVLNERYKYIHMIHKNNLTNNNTKVISSHRSAIDISRPETRNVHRGAIQTRGGQEISMLQRGELKKRQMKKSSSKSQSF